jgi:predicted AAA+ superfamily ATPase
MYQRIISHKLEAALGDTRAVLLNGARQTGKSTLAQLVAKQQNGRYLSLDDPTILALARSDPSALVTATDGLTVIDEVQLAPDLFPAIKRVVDHDPRPGRFLLTGSANIFLIPRLSESLAGRMEILPLAPLSQLELITSTSTDQNGTWVDHLFSTIPWQAQQIALDRMDICSRVIAGGFPEALTRKTSDRRNAWFRSYIASLLQRDIRDLAQIDGLTDLPRLLGLLAARSSALMNISEISRSSGLPHTTLRRYLALLEAVFMLQLLPAWSSNLGKRFVKSPKIHLLDSGLAAHLRGDTDPKVLAQSHNLGPLLETFAIQEIRRLLAASQVSADLYHFRSAAGQEVDLVLEAPGQNIAGIEIKAAAKLEPRDFDGLRTLAADAGDKFIRGAVLYLGEQRLQFADKLWAEPMSSLWLNTPSALH